MMALHVADQALHETGPFPDRRKIARLLPRARRFVFSDAASVTLGRFIRDCPDLILDHFQFARAPYPVTYVEFNLAASALPFEGNNKVGEADYFVGFLTDGESLWSCAASENEKSAFTAYKYLVGQHRVWPLPLPTGETDWPRDQEWTTAALYLGSTLVPVLQDREYYYPKMKALMAAWSHAPLLPDIYHRYNFNTVYGQAGDLRLYLAATLLLNQPKHVLFSHQPNVVGMRRGRRVVYAAHHVVEVDLGRRTDLRRLFSFPSDRDSPRRHQVRGHYAHFATDQRCAHTWPIFPLSMAEEEPRWRCGKCGGLRVWRKAHERGDASRGFITKEYAVEDRHE